MTIVTPIPRLTTYLLTFLSAFAGFIRHAQGTTSTTTPAMTASWQANPEPDIESYIIHFGTRPDHLDRTAEVGRETTFVFDNLEPATVYYCAVVARNTAGLESEMSDVAVFIAPHFDATLSDSDAWMRGHGFTPGDPMGVDHNGDGVPLLTSYALNLNPHGNPCAGMPRAQAEGGKLTLRFFAGRDDVTYRVEASPDMKTWSAAGVTLGAADVLYHRTASIPLAGANKFLRLVLVR